MGLTEEIAIKLGIKAGDLKSVLSDAGATIKQFKKEGEGGDDEGFRSTSIRSRRGSAT
jgi:hypothetical protein